MAVTFDPLTLLDVLPDLIADAVRARTQPPAGAVTKSTATVMSVLSASSAEIQLDEDEPGTFTTVQVAAFVQAGDRVVVFHSAGGGAVILGSGSAQFASAVIPPTIDLSTTLVDEAGVPIVDDVGLAILTA